MNFEETYSTYFHNVYLYTCTLTQNQSLAEEITQETFVRAMDSLDQFDGKKDILA